MKNKLGLVILLLLILLVPATLFLNRYIKYNTVSNLIIVEEMNIVERSPLKYNAYPKLVYNGDEKLELHVVPNKDSGIDEIMVDTSANATVIEVNSAECIVDNEILYGILSKYDCKPSSRDYYPYMHEDVIVDFEVVQNHKSKHILLGDLNIWYEYGDSVFYEIIDGEQLKNEIVELVIENAR